MSNVRLSAFKKKLLTSILFGLISCSVCLIFAYFGDFSEGKDYFILFSGFSLCTWWHCAGDLVDCLFEWFDNRKSSVIQHEDSDL